MKFEKDNRYAIRKIGKVVTSLTVASSLMVLTQVAIHAEESEPNKDIDEAVVTNKLDRGQATAEELEARQALEASQAEDAANQAALDQAQTSYQEDQKKLNDRQGDVEETLGQIKDQASSNDTRATKAKKALENKVDQLEADQKSIQEALGQSEEKQAEIAHRLADKEKEMPEADKALKEIDAKVQAATQVQAASQAKVDQALNEKAQAQESLDQASAAVAKASEAAQQASDNVDQLTKDFEAAQAKVADLTHKEQAIDQSHSVAQSELQKAQTDLEKAQKALDEAKLLADTRKEDLAQKKAQLAKLQTQQADQTAKQESLEQALLDNDKQVTQLEESIQTNQAIQDKAETRKKALDEALVQNKADQVEAQTDVTKAQNKIDHDKRELTLAQQALKDAQAEFEKADQAVKGIVSEKAKKEAQAQWDRGSVGFFEKMGAEEALKVFTEKDNADKTYLKATEEAGDQDSRSLDRMKQAIEEAKVVNAKRQKDKGIDGRKLSVLGITDFDMAVAQANANYSAGNRGHAGVHNPPYENLAWGSSTAKEALEGWWDREKLVFDYLRGQGLKSRIQMQEYIKTHGEEIEKATGVKQDRQKIGHYTNLVDDLMWGQYEFPPSQSIGYALRPTTGSRAMFRVVHSMVLNNTPTGKVYSLDEYTDRFARYYDDLNNKRQGIYVPSQEDQENLQKAKDKLEAVKARVNQAKATLTESQQVHQAKVAELSKLQQKEKELDQQMSQQAQALQEAKDQIQAAEAKKLETEDQAHQIQEALDQVKEELAQVEPQLAAAKEAVNKTQDDQLEADRQLTAAKADQQAKDQLVKQNAQKVVDLGQALKQASTNVQEAQKLLDKKTSELAAAKTELTDKTTHLTADQAALETKRQADQRAAEQLRTAQDQLAQAKADLAQLIEEQEQVSTKYAVLSKLRQEKLAVDSDVDKLQKQVQALAEALETAKAALPAAKEAFDAARSMWERVQAIDLEKPETYQVFADLAGKVQAWQEAQGALVDSREHLDQATEAKQKSAIALEQATQLHRQKVRALQAVLMEERYDQIQPSVELEVKDQELPYSQQVKENPDLPQGERRIIQKGQMGLKRTFTEVTTHANGQVSRKVLDYTADDRLPVDEIVEVGTKLIQAPTPQGPAGDEKPVQPEQPSKETNKPSQEQAQGQPKESNNPAQGQTQGHPGDKGALAPANPQAAVLPQTGESDPSLIFGMAALSILASVGLVTPRSKRQ